MIIQPQTTAPAVTHDELSAKMKIRFHIYPDARSTTRISYCSAWARRYARSNRVN